MRSAHEELRKSVETEFIDKDYSSNHLYLPQLITNNRLKNKKVLSKFGKTLLKQELLFKSEVPV